MWIGLWVFQEVNVESLEKGFRINVYSEKNCPGLLVSILEAFEELGLNVLDASVSCADNFHLQAVGGEVRNRILPNLSVLIYSWLNVQSLHIRKLALKLTSLHHTMLVEKLVCRSAWSHEKWICYKVDSYLYKLIHAHQELTRVTNALPWRFSLL